MQKTNYKVSYLHILTYTPLSFQTYLSIFSNFSKTKILKMIVDEKKTQRLACLKPLDNIKSEPKLNSYFDHF